MAFYKYGTFLTQSNHNEFDEIRKPGEIAEYSGIYKCEGCGKEDVSTAGHHLPPQNHHQHSQEQGSIRWRLIVGT